MRKLHSLAVFALVTPVIALGAASALAQSTMGQNGHKEITSRDQDARISMPESEQGEQRSTKSIPAPMQDNRGTQRLSQSDASAAAERRSTREQASMQNRGHIGSAPVNGMHASDLIGAKVKTTQNEEVGPVNDLIIGENGQVVAIVIGVGGFLGMGEKDVAVGWDHVSRSGASDEQGLRIDVSREDLGSAPKFAKRD